MGANGRRPAGRTNRIELETLRRRARANTHLDRVRNERRTRAPRWMRGVGIAGAGGFALVIGLWVGDDAVASWGDTAWRVESVEVLGVARLTPLEVAQAAGLAPGAPYAAADPARVAATLGEHAWIADARAARLPGGTVVVSVREREPLAVIETRGGPLGVDAEGRSFAVLDSGEASDLPRLRCEDAPPPGEADARIAEAIRLARSLPKRGLALPREIELGAESDPEGVVLRLPGIDARFVLGSEDLDARVGKKAELLAKRPAEVADAASVDLRFAGQAVLRDKGDDPDGSA